MFCLYLFWRSFDNLAYAIFQNSTCVKLVHNNNDNSNINKYIAQFITQETTFFFVWQKSGQFIKLVEMTVITGSNFDSHNSVLSDTRKRLTGMSFAIVPVSATKFHGSGTSFNTSVTSCSVCYIITPIETRWPGDVMKRPGQKILMPYPITMCGPRCCFPIAKT